MSVINTMLRDLDKRNGRAAGQAVAGDAVRSTKAVSPWHMRPRVAILLGLAGVSAAAALWMQYRGASAATPPVVPAPRLPVIANQAPSPALHVAAAPAVAPADGASAPAAKAQAPQANVAQSKAVASTAAVHAPAPDAKPKVIALARAAAPAPAASAAGPDQAATAAPAATAANGATNAKAAIAKTYSPGQNSANLLNEAITLDQQGRQEDAKAPLQRALAANPFDLKARQMLIRLQMDTGKVEEARVLLSEGQRLHSDRSEFTLALARLKVESGDSTSALQLLEAGRAVAGDEPQYHALMAVLLLRAQRYDEATKHYLVALRSDPGNTRWLVGVGAALEGAGHRADAAEAYRRAQGTSDLTPEMTSFLGERLAQLKTRQEPGLSNEKPGAAGATVVRTEQTVVSGEPQ
jgi:MSHA biogenesis protein MshN